MRHKAKSVSDISRNANGSKAALAIAFFRRWRGNGDRFVWTGELDLERDLFEIRNYGKISYSFKQQNTWFPAVFNKYCETKSK